MTSSGVGRSGANPGITTSELAAIRVKALRKSRGMTAAQLAARCSALGAGTITTNVIANIETRRREITLNELMIFALALDVAPIHLLTPTETTWDQPLKLTSTVQVPDLDLAGRWIHGQQALPITDETHYRESGLAATHPGAADQNETRFAQAIVMDGAKRLATQYEAQATAFQNSIREQVTHLLTGLESAITQATKPADIAEVLADARTRLDQEPAPVGTTPARTRRRR